MSKEKYTKVVVERLIKKLKTRNMEGIYFQNEDELKAYLDNELQANEKICSGGSATMKELGLIDYLNNREDVNFLDRSKADTREDALNMMREAFTADSFFMSTNAITRDGVLVNIDGTGNRLAALIFGPKKVYIICGTNKICDDVESAYNRAKNVAAPPNCIRFEKSTPCVETGKCEGCLSDECICNQIVVTRNSRDNGRIKILIVDGEYGY